VTWRRRRAAIFASYWPGRYAISFRRELDLPPFENA
jgi:hypothetical protein